MRRQLLFGALLLACTIGLSVYFYGMDRDEIIPEIGPGLTTATVVDGELYVIKAEVVWAMHMRQQPRLPFKIYRFPLSAFA